MLGAFSGDARVTGHGWIYGFMWVDVRGEVRGFYFRCEGMPDVDVYPLILTVPQEEGTA